MSSVHGRGLLRDSDAGFDGGVLSIGGGRVEVARRCLHVPRGIRDADVGAVGVRDCSGLVCSQDRRRASCTGRWLAN